MISPRQIKAARELLSWSQIELANRADVSWATLKRFERDRDEKASPRDRYGTMLKIKQALEAAGIEFIEADGSIGVCLRKK